MSEQCSFRRAAGTPDEYRRGVRCGWLFGDIQGIHHAVNTGSAGIREVPTMALAAVGTLLKARIHSTWRLSDPLPTWVIYSRYAESGIRKLLQKS